MKNNFTVFICNIKLNFLLLNQTRETKYYCTLYTIQYTKPSKRGIEGIRLVKVTYRELFASDKNSGHCPGCQNCKISGKTVGNSPPPLPSNSPLSNSPSSQSTKRFYSSN